MTRDERGSPVSRFVQASFSLLAAAAALYLAVRLIESIAATLVLIVAAIGGLGLASFVLRMVWRRNRFTRW